MSTPFLIRVFFAVVFAFDAALRPGLYSGSDELIVI